jgi:hypothetical protein
MNLKQRIEAFVKLGQRINQLTVEEKEDLFWRVNNSNAWFTPDNIENAIFGLGQFLDQEALFNWTSKYQLNLIHFPKKIGIIMAGNIPAVGFHDLLCVLIAGHEAHVKLSSSDPILIPWLVKELVSIAPDFSEKVFFLENLKGKDAYIATGSDNSARYFDYYFGKYPHIIRKNRTSVAVLSGEESSEDFQLLGKDVLQYFGLGCRNVSKLYVKNIDQIKRFLDAINHLQVELNHHKFVNNYDYNKSIYLVNKEPHLDNGFLLIRESKELVSPIAVLHYEIYHSEEDIVSTLENLKEKIQCVVSKEGWFEGSFPFGLAQCPVLEDYADGVDTLHFLETL